MDNDIASLEQLGQLCRQRSGLYASLASLFEFELNQDQIDRLSFPETADDDESDIGRGYALMARYFREHTRNPRPQLAADYAHLFLGAGEYQNIIASPYESVYTSEENLLMQDARDEVLACYRAWGLDAPEGNGVPEDHASFELMFMSQLADRTAEALAEPRPCVAHALLESQQQFLREHLLVWMPQLCADIDRNAKTDFYRGVATLCEGVLKLDDELVEDCLEQLQHREVA